MKDTKFRVTLEHTDYGTVEAKLSKKGVKSITKSVKRPLTLMLVVLSLLLLSGIKALVEQSTVRSILPMFDIEQKDK